MAQHRTTPPVHGTAQPPGVTVDACNAELREDGGYVGDRASRGAFRSIVEHWRERLRQVGKDPLGDRAIDDIGKCRLEQVLLHGDTEAAGLVLSAVDEFAQALAHVCRRLLALEAWQGTQRIAVGGGFRGSRLGELAIGRADVLLKAELGVALRPIHRSPGEAGLIGAAFLVSRQAADRPVLGVDIGGSKIRVGMVAGREREALVLETEVWRHAEEPTDRDQMVHRLAKMLQAVVGRGVRQGASPGPFIGIGCPGLIRADGGIQRGSQNLPGDWEAPDFRLPERLARMLPPIGGHPPEVVLHNDAVAQGLSERPWMHGMARWGVLTIGTGLGNARFTNRN